MLVVCHPCPNVLVSHFRFRFDSRRREGTETFAFSMYPLADVGVAIRIVHFSTAVCERLAGGVIPALSFVYVSLRVAATKIERNAHNVNDGRE